MLTCKISASLSGTQNMLLLIFFHKSRFQCTLEEGCHPRWHTYHCHIAHYQVFAWKGCQEHCFDEPFGQTWWQTTTRNEPQARCWSLGEALGQVQNNSYLNYWHVDLCNSLMIVWVPRWKPLAATFHKMVPSFCLKICVSMLKKKALVLIVKAKRSRPAKKTLPSFLPVWPNWQTCMWMMHLVRHIAHTHPWSVSICNLACLDFCSRRNWNTLPRHWSVPRSPFWPFWVVPRLRTRYIVVVVVITILDSNYQQLVGQGL